MVVVTRGRRVGVVMLVGVATLVTACGAPDSPAASSASAGESGEPPKVRSEPPASASEAASPEPTPSSPPEHESELIRRRIAEEAGGVDPSTWDTLPSEYYSGKLYDELTPGVRECTCERFPDDEPQAIRLDTRFVGAPGIGGAIDSVEPGDGNELAEDDPLMKCIRDVAFRIELPPPEARGSATA